MGAKQATIRKVVPVEVPEEEPQVKSPKPEEVTNFFPNFFPNFVWIFPKARFPISFWILFPCGYDAPTFMAPPTQNNSNNAAPQRRNR